MDNLLLTLAACFFWLIISAYAWRAHQQRKQTATPQQTDLIIAYASQTGYAEGIAKQYAEHLTKKHQVSILPLNNLSIETLTQAQKILFVVSTYGEGDAPDNASLFSHRFIGKEPLAITLSQLQYSIIALGDNSYPDFCGFGYALEKRLQHHGAQALSSIITVNCYEPNTTPLADISPDWLNISARNSAENASQQLNHYWQLIKRTQLNPNTPASGLYQLYLKSIGPMPTWQAGDLFDLQPENTPEQVQAWLNRQRLDGEQWITLQNYGQQLQQWLKLKDLSNPIASQHDNIEQQLQQLPNLHKRSYSIASIPEEGIIELIVRQQHNKTQQLGIGSGFLTQHCQIGDIIKGDIHTVNAYHSHENTQPMILIGAGSGLAGLKAQITARNMLQSASNIWLIYGERDNQPNLPLNQLLNNWLAKKNIEQLDCAFSQPSEQEQATSTKYVQNILTSSQNQIKQWHQQGASFYVCGSLSGMGESVHQALQAILGEETLATLQYQGKYIRDVY